MIRSPASVFATTPPRIRGVVMMVTAAVAVVCMNVLIRKVAAELHPFEIAFFRNVFAFLVFVPWLAGSGMGALRTGRLGLHATRAALNLVAMLLFFVGLTLVPLAKVSALGFTSPLFASLLAVLILHEPMTRVRAVGLGIGFLGALVVLRPGIGAFNAGGLLVLGSTAVWAFALICIKVLARTDSSLTIAVYAALLQIPFALVPALFVWQWPNGAQWAEMAAIGGLGGLGHLCLAQAFRDADATVVLPADFTKLIWASIAGYLVFGEVPDLWTWVGGLVICGAVFHLAARGGGPRRA